MRIITFIKNWTLPIAMISGVVSYFVYVNIDALKHTHQFAADCVSVVQPALIFTMLFLSFCKVHPRQLRPHRWHLTLLLIQSLSFVGLALPVIIWPDIPGRVIIESAMICMICPTATAASVFTGKLHGNASAVVSYTCAINLVAAVLIPAVVSALHSGSHDISFATSFAIIIGHVFPLLILPLILAFLVRYSLPKFHAKCVSISGISFYLWAMALALAVCVTTKALMHSDEGIIEFVGIALVSLLTCIIQFYVGHRVGKKHGETIAGTQSLGQKNTAFVIWVSYTFMNPVTALAGGFYAIWHNIVNSYQIWRQRKENKTEIQ